MPKHKPKKSTEPPPPPPPPEDSSTDSSKDDEDSDENTVDDSDSDTNTEQPNIEKEHPKKNKTSIKKGQTMNERYTPCEINNFGHVCQTHKGAINKRFMETTMNKNILYVLKGYGNDDRIPRTRSGIRHYIRKHRKKTLDTMKLKPVNLEVLDCGDEPVSPEERAEFQSTIKKQRVQIQKQREEILQIHIENAKYLAHLFAKEIGDSQIYQPVVNVRSLSAEEQDPYLNPRPGPSGTSRKSRKKPLKRLQNKKSSKNVSSFPGTDSEDSAGEDLNPPEDPKLYDDEDATVNSTNSHLEPLQSNKKRKISSKKVSNFIGTDSEDSDGNVSNPPVDPNLSNDEDAVVNPQDSSGRSRLESSSEEATINDIDSVGDPLIPPEDSMFNDDRNDEVTPKASTTGTKTKQVAPTPKKRSRSKTKKSNEKVPVPVKNKGKKKKLSKDESSTQKKCHQNEISFSSNDISTDSNICIPTVPESDASDNENNSQILPSHSEPNRSRQISPVIEEEEAFKPDEDINCDLLESNLEDNLLRNHSETVEHSQEESSNQFDKVQNVPDSDVQISENFDANHNILDGPQSTKITEHESSVHSVTEQVSCETEINDMPSLFHYSPQAASSPISNSNNTSQDSLRLELEESDDETIHIQSKEELQAVSNDLSSNKNCHPEHSTSVSEDQSLLELNINPAEKLELDQNNSNRSLDESDIFNFDLQPHHVPSSSVKKKYRESRGTFKDQTYSRISSDARSKSVVKDRSKHTSNFTPLPSRYTFQRKAPKRRNISTGQNRLLTNRHTKQIRQKKRLEEEQKIKFVSKAVFGKPQKLTTKFTIPKKNKPSASATSSVQFEPNNSNQEDKVEDISNANKEKSNNETKTDTSSDNN